MQRYDKLSINQRVTPQSEKAKPGQVKNNADGYVFKINDWQRLDRFLILGSDSNTYYQSAQELTKQNVDSIKTIIEKDGIGVINRVVEISKSGRAPKNDPAIFVLAMCSGSDNKEVRKHALNYLSDVCRIPTHLFMFLEYAKLFRGRGRLFQEALRKWYMDKSPDRLVYHMLKYRQREGWTHRDVLRLAKPKGAEGVHQSMFSWVTGKQVYPEQWPEMLNGFVACQNSENEIQCAGYIREYGLSREMVPTQFLKSPVVWEALLEKMPMTAMIRNLGNMGSCGLLTPMSNAVQEVTRKINQEAIEKSKIHPMSILYAAKTYAQGYGFKGSNNWTVDGNIVDALDDAFYMAFKNVDASGKRFLIGIDVSGSMASMKHGGIMSPREIAAAMSVVHARIEPLVHYMAFSHGFTPLPITKRSTINHVMDMTCGFPFQRTDCAVPMLYALENKIPVDCFIIYTDNETWFGRIHPFQALKKYREIMGINAKLVVCGVTSTGFSIADPDDPGMLDIVGFDSAVPLLINDFVSKN